MPTALTYHKIKRIKHERQSASERGYGWKWRNANRTGAADAFLREHPTCHYCEQAGTLTPATCVDHFVPHKGNQQLFWDESNWRASCASCHNRKTASEGAFGRPIG